jgi:fucose 4-O-acetylase-like acetyltransferase
MAGAESISKADIGAVYIAKGIGFVLVVCGHYVPDRSPAFWRGVHDVIWQFHMPLFFILAGYLYRGTPIERYGAHVRKKIRRLILPYISIAAIFFIIKFAPRIFLKLGDPVSLGTLANIFINPVNSYVPLLWFIYTLFLIFLIFPLFELLVRKRALIFAVTLLFIFLRTTDMFCISMVLHNLVFFAFGFMFSSSVDLGKRYTTWLIAPLAAAGVVGFILMNTLLLGFFLRFPALFAAHTCGVALLGGLVCILCAMLLDAARSGLISKGLERIGYYSMSIYLFHTLFTGSVRVIVERTLPAGLLLFVMTTFLAIGVGLLGPLVLEKYVLRKNVFARKFILGLR